MRRVADILVGRVPGSRRAGIIETYRMSDYAEVRIEFEQTEVRLSLCFSPEEAIALACDLIQLAREAQSRRQSEVE